MQRRIRCGVSAALACAALALPTVASAEPYTHDGFFFQGSLGFGPGWVDEKIENTNLELSMSGLTAMFEVAFGGTLGSGFVLGGKLTGHSIINPTLELGGQEAETEDTSVGISQVALFAQWYPQPKSGLYLHGSVGYAAASVTVDDVTRDANTDGVVLGVGAGYDFWVAKEWAVGPQFRFTYAHLTGEEGGIEATDDFLSPILAVSVTYH